MGIEQRFRAFSRYRDPWRWAARYRHACQCCRLLCQIAGIEGKGYGPVEGQPECDVLQRIVIGVYRPHVCDDSWIAQGRVGRGKRPGDITNTPSRGGRPIADANGAARVRDSLEQLFNAGANLHTVATDPVSPFDRQYRAHD